MQPTMKDEGYRFHSWAKGGGANFEHVESRAIELWAANKNHASAGFRWRGTDWEFCGTIKYAEI